ncbi:putative hydroxyphenylpyruvate reductase [Dioscorea sansibarensis]
MSTIICAGLSLPELLWPPMAASQTLETADLHPETILILYPVAPAVIAAVSHRFNLLKLWESPLSKPQFLAAHAASTRALIVNGSTPVDAEILDALPRLLLIFSTSAGLNHIDLPECARRGVSIANAPEIFSADVADYAVGLLINVLRGVSSSDRYVHKGLWPVNGDFPLGFKFLCRRRLVFSLLLTSPATLRGTCCCHSPLQLRSLPLPLHLSCLFGHHHHLSVGKRKVIVA